MSYIYPIIHSTRLNSSSKVDRSIRCNISVYLLRELVNLASGS